MVADLWDANESSDRDYTANKVASLSKILTLCAFPHRLRLVLRVLCQLRDKKHHFTL